MPRGQPTVSVKAQMSSLGFARHIRLLSYIFLWDFKKQQQQQKQVFKNIKTILRSTALQKQGMAQRWSASLRLPTPALK